MATESADVEEQMERLNLTEAERTNVIVEDGYEVFLMVLGLGTLVSGSDDVP
jgi:hypothetical protein